MYRTYYVNLALKHQTSQLSQSDQNENGNVDSTCLELLTFIVRLVSNASKVNQTNYALHINCIQSIIYGANSYTIDAPSFISI